MKAIQKSKFSQNTEYLNALDTFLQRCVQNKAVNKNQQLIDNLVELSNTYATYDKYQQIDRFNELAHHHVLQQLNYLYAMQDCGIQVKETVINFID